MSLTTEYSLWFIWICLLTGIGAAWLLYRNNPLRLEGRLAKPLSIALFSLRAALIFLLLFLLLGPLLKWLSHKSEKPVVVVAIDNSESVSHTADSSFYRNEMVKALQDLSSELGGDYEVKPYLFGKGVREAASPDFKDKRSDIAGLFETVYDQYDGQNLGAIVVASDGIYNEGADPLNAASRLHAPVYAVALGDTSQRRDLLIKNVRYNRFVYSGNSFPVQVDVAAYFCNNEQARLTVSHDGKVIRNEQVSLSGNAFFRSFNISLEAVREGVQHYTISLSPLNKEVTLVNNTCNIFINVINGRQKILLVALAPHPDLTAYKSAIDANGNYECRIVLWNEFESLPKAGDYQMAILHQLPGLRGEGLNIIKRFRESGMPMLYVLGGQTGIQFLGPATANALTISSNRIAINDASAVFQPSFSLFTFSEAETEKIRRMPPMQSPFGTYGISGETDMLFRQQIGYVKTDYPLWFFIKGSAQKSGLICGEGFWKWRLYDQEISNGELTGSLISKTIQYLAAKKDQSRFRVTGKKQFDDTEPVTFDAELYNESFELINEPNANILIRDEKGKEYRFAFSKTDHAYAIDAGVLAPGSYSYEATAELGVKPEKAKGRFVVTASQIEFSATTADHQLLNEIAQSSGGKLFYPRDIGKIAEQVRANEKITPVVYSQQELKSMISLKWIFFLLLAFVSVEWFIRKWNGTI